MLTYEINHSVGCSDVTIARSDGFEVTLFDAPTPRAAAMLAQLVRDRLAAEPDMGRQLFEITFVRN